MPDQTPPLQPIPVARVEGPKKRRVSMVWIVPIVAALAGVWIAATSILGAGPKFTLILHTADGVEAGKTKVKYNGVEIGTLIDLRLSDDHKTVITTVQMAPKTENCLVEDTEFWVVRPRISGATVTGLGTLISGAYIGVGLGKSQKPKREFVALDTEPVVGGGSEGRYFVLKTHSLGSIDNGTPIYYRKLKVGEVASYKLDDDGQALTLEVFVSAPYDKFVSTNTRFWHASGVDVSLSAAGMKVQTQSLLSILIGGLAFDEPPDSKPAPEAEANHEFTLFSDQERAFEVPLVHPVTFLLEFKETVRGLKPGAPVEFQGIQVGTVTEVSAIMDATTGELTIPVKIVVDSAHLGISIVNAPPGEDRTMVRHQLLQTLVEHGMRAQLKTASLLTGALMVSIDRVPGAPPATIDWSQTPARIPTAPGGFVVLEEKVTSILQKLEALPWQAIGEDVRNVIEELDQTLVSAHRTVDNVDGLITSKLGSLELKPIVDDIRKVIADLDSTVLSARGAMNNVNDMTKPDSVLNGELTDTLQEISRAARNLGVLLDYLERHPEALLRGKDGDSK